MARIGFDNQKYLTTQSEQIRKRIAQFGGKLYLEFGGKLFDDYHASRVLPGFEPDSKIRMLQQLSDDAEIVIAINAADIEKNKVRGDLGITYDADVLRLIDTFRELNLYVGSVVMTRYTGQASADAFLKRLNTLGIKCYKHYNIAGYPNDVKHIVSDEGFGINDYIETTRPLVIVTAPGPGSGKMATCLSQLYHEHKRGISAGYAKFETFPVWNLPLKHPVNLAYEAATADLNDVNMIDPFHLEVYGEKAVNYNRDVEIFPVLNATFVKIHGHSPYQSPTDMGVNMVGSCIVDDEAARYASAQEVIARYYTALCDYKMGKISHKTVEKLKYIIGLMQLTPSEDRPCVRPALEKHEMTGKNCVAYELCDGTIITGKASDIMSATSSATVNAIKYLSGIPDHIKLIPAEVLVPMLKLKREVLGSRTSALKLDDVLLALTVSMATNPMVEQALNQLPNLRGTDLHSSVMLRTGDVSTLKKLGVRVTCEDKFPENSLSFSLNIITEFLQSRYISGLFFCL